MTRVKLPPQRNSITHKCVIDGKQGRRAKMFFTVGLYDDGRPGELFITADQEDPTTRGILHAMAICISLLLQTGTDINHIADKISYMRYEPYGFTKNPDIPMCSSITDYLGKWLNRTFPRKEDPDSKHLSHKPQH